MGSASIFFQPAALFGGRRLDPPPSPAGGSFGLALPTAPTSHSRPSTPPWRIPVHGIRPPAARSFFDRDLTAGPPCSSLFRASRFYVFGTQYNLVHGAKRVSPTFFLDQAVGPNYIHMISLLTFLSAYTSSAHVFGFYFDMIPCRIIFWMHIMANGGRFWIPPHPVRQLCLQIQWFPLCALCNPSSPKRKSNISFLLIFFSRCS